MVQSGFKARVIIERDDLLATSQHPIVLTANRHFDCSPEWVSERSLVGQLSSRWFDNDSRTRWAERIDTTLGSPSGVAAHPVGTVVRVAENDQTALLLSVSSRHPENRSAVVIDEIWTALSAADLVVTSAMEYPICAMRIVARDSTDLDLFELTRSYWESLGFRER
jgi:hypothetical protein